MAAGLMTLAIITPGAAAAAGASLNAAREAESPARRYLPLAEISQVARSADAKLVKDWIVATGDNHGLPFIIVDKAGAELRLFDAHGSLLAKTAVLLGSARGDDSPAGIGDRPLARITPAERITPAGRFLASRGHNSAGQDILWVDYDAAISLHRATDVKPGLTTKDRLARLASATTLDNRISHGCINVSVAFYDDIIGPTFRGTDGIVYVLPETRSVREVFHMPSMEQARLQPAGAKLSG